MRTLYLLAGCNGAGKTTAAYALLPDLSASREFVNSLIKLTTYLQR